MDKDFAPPLDSVPLFESRLIANTPPEATIRGMFPQRVLDVVGAAGKTLPGFGPYTGFRSYPVREFMTLLAAGARVAHPLLPVRGALRRLGYDCYAAFLDSMLGKVMLGALGGNIQAMVDASSKAYPATQSHGRMTLAERGDRSCVLRFTQLYQYWDCFEVGVVEAAVKSCGLQSEVLVKRENDHTGLMKVSWF